jgi:glycosyltransferase involved in cell wall biosynthesis
MTLSLDDVTAYYIVKNEDVWVRQSIEITKEHVGDVLVVDTGSIDGTIEEVKKTGARLIENGPFDWELFSKVKNKYLVEEVKTPLVLFIDGNEIMTHKGFKWIRKALSHVDLSDMRLDPTLSIPQYDVFDLTKNAGDSVVVGYYDLVRGRRRLCFKDRIAYRRGFGKSIIGRKHLKDNSKGIVFGPHINDAPGLFWHMRYLGHSSMDAEDATRRARNSEALAVWSKYPQKFKTCDYRDIYGESSND